MYCVKQKGANFPYACGVGSILLTFWVGLAALPCVQFGIWADSEPVIIACGFLISIAGLLAINFIPTAPCSSSHLSFSTVRDKISHLHPVWFCIWGLPLLGLLLLPFHPYHLLSLLGPANLGQGIINGFMIAIGTVVMCFFLKKTPTLLASGAIIAGLGLTLLSYLSTSSSSFSSLYQCFMLHNFRSWLAVVALGILALGFIYTNSQKRLALVLCAGIILFLSQNKTVILCFLVCLCCGGILRFFNKQRWLNHSGWALFLCILPILCIFGIIVGANFE